MTWSRALTSALLFLSVASGCVEPNFGPQPGPGPAPSPVVNKSDKMWVIVVDDEAKRGTDDGQKVVQVLEQLEDPSNVAPHVFRSYSVNNPAVHKFDAEVKAAGGDPCVIFKDFKTAKDLGEAPLPRSWADMQSLIKKYGK